MIESKEATAVSQWLFSYLPRDTIQKGVGHDLLSRAVLSSARMA